MATQKLRGRCLAVHAVTNMDNAMGLTNRRVFHTPFPQMSLVSRTSTVSVVSGASRPLTRSRGPRWHSTSATSSITENGASRGSGCHWTLLFGVSEFKYRQGGSLECLSDRHAELGKLMYRSILVCNYGVGKVRAVFECREISTPPSVLISGVATWEAKGPPPTPLLCMMEFFSRQGSHVISLGSRSESGVWGRRSTCRGRGASWGSILPPGTPCSMRGNRFLRI